MKKVVLIIISIFLFSINVYAEEPNEHEFIQVDLVRCDSTKNIWVKENDDVKRINLISYDKDDGELNKEIDTYLCALLNKADKIEIEYDIEKKDKYNRELVHVFVDGNYIQELLIKKGYGQVNFVQGEYKYLNELCSVQKEAIIKGEGIWKYEGIKEKYCNSNVKIGQKEETKEETKIEEKKINNKNLYKIIFFNMGALILILLMAGRKKHGKR